MARAAIRRDIDEEVDQERRGYSLDEAIESIAFGWFQIALLLLCGATQLADATELMVLSLLNNPVQCAFDVSKEEAAWLASAVFAGMLCGAYLTGLVADQFGRRAGFGMTTSLVAGFGLASAAVLTGRRFLASTSQNTPPGAALARAAPDSRPQETHEALDPRP